MKKSIVTGATIYKKISNVSKELNEIGMGMDEVEQNSVAYSILQKAYDEKKQELRELDNTKYIVHNTGEVEWGTE
jgi:hypothetical protein